ncbi:MAG: hypothetical protein WB647_11840 [Roseiarcus sp.]|uniref:hypothetical protein n=1 Tax=Roseiarcus sp. TaxID=1969460 RepID=UPI003C3C5ACD
MSKKTVSFAMPAGAPRARKPESIALEALSASHRSAGARPDDWVRDRDLAAPPWFSDDALAPPRILLDVAAERSLIEVLSLSFLMPFALGWFWWINALAGRARL